MGKQIFVNNFDTTFSAAVSDHAISGTPATELGYGILQLPTGAAAYLTTLATGDYYILTAYKVSGTTETNREIMYVTYVDTSVFGETRITVSRAQEGTTAQAYVAGDALSMRLTKGGMANLVQRAGDTLTGQLNSAATVTIASAGTTDIGAAASNEVIISGTTTITSLGSYATAGARRFVTFSGALTLTHHATNLILPGGANITTVAGDTAEFVTTGTGWRCTDYTPATVTGTGGQVRATNPTFASLTNSGNLTFSGTGNRITGDFSNGTVANRVILQSTTTNGPSVLSAIPNGTGTVAGFDAFNNSNTTAAARGRFYIDATATHIDSTTLGGTQLPLYLDIAGVNKVALDTSGNITYQSTGSALNNVASINSGQLAGFRNKIINGDFKVWQRGTSFAGGTGVGTGYNADRWQGIRAAFATGMTISRQTSGLAGIFYNARVQRDSGNTGTGYLAIATNLETSDSIPLQGKTVTVSFWGRAGANFSAASSLLACQLISGTGVDQNQLTAGFTGSTVVASISATLVSGTWTLYQATATVGSSITQLAVVFSCIPVGTAGAADYFEITGVQVEPGSVATPFEQVPYATTLALCQRYYQTYGFSANAWFRSGYNVATATDDVTYPLTVTMRSAPTGAIVGTWGVSNCSQPSIPVTTASSVMLRTTVAATGAFTYNVNTSAQGFTLSAEL